jgi:anti-anti-sigma regulatory factor
MNAIANLKYPYGDPACDCGGAQVSAHCRHVATVVTVHGHVDAKNVERVSEYARRFILGDNPIILDLSDAEPISDATLKFLNAVAEDCRAAGVEWTLVASADALRKSGLPGANTVCEALKDYDDEITLRRQLMLPLILKTA